MLVTCWLSFTLTSIDRSTWGPASVFVGEGLAVPVASLGVFATAYYVGYVISNAIGGIGVDRFGARIVLTVSLAGAGVFMTAFGSTKSATVGIAVQAVVGLFAGADYAAGVRLISSWFPNNKLGMPMGVFTTATSLGTAIANAVVPALIAWHGWGTSYHLFGIISIVVAGLLLFVLRNGPQEAKGQKRAPVVERKPGGILGPDLRAFLRNRDVVLTCLTGFCGFWGLYGFVTWANALMIKGRDIDAGTAGLVVAIFAITAVAVKPLVGLITDRFFGGARKTPSLVLFAVFALTLVWFGNVSSPTAFIWLAPLLGAAAYGWAALLVALIPRLVPSSVTGSVAGISNAIWQLGSVLVPLAVGAVFSATSSFNAAFLTLAAGPALAIVFMLPVRDRAGDRQQATSAESEEKVPESV
ncbi:MFS transporter [Streptomyces sp. NPDC005356]|uniref:MFS transporter n=2 Tax=Streptomyces TaxID=1883 RepID=UPI0033A17214